MESPRTIAGDEEEVEQAQEENEEYDEDEEEELRRLEDGDPEMDTGGSQ